MDDNEPRTSEEHLQQLRAEGKISEEEYHKLLAVMQDQPVERRTSNRGSEPEFQAFRKRILVGAMAICLIGLPASILLQLPDVVRLYVGGLSIAGLIVGSIKLRRMRENS